MTVLKFDLEATFGHMRRLEGTTVRQTYRVPPKTTIMGLLAGVLGMDRNSYYRDFDDWVVSVVPQNIRTMDIPTHLLSTDDEVKEISSNGVKIGTGVRSDTSRENRQRTPVEYLVDPKYTIYVKSDNTEDNLAELNRKIQKNEYHYTPTLGVSECLCYLGNPSLVNIQNVQSDKIDSVAPESKGRVQPSEGNALSFERVAKGFEKTEDGRKPTGFTSVTIDTNCGKLNVESDNIYEVTETDHNILFY